MAVVTAPLPKGAEVISNRQNNKRVLF